MRVFRVLFGIVAILVALPLLIGGVLLWFAIQHRSADDTFRAGITPLHTPGYAIVVPDIDSVLRRDAPFARAGGVVLHLDVTSADGPLFVGLAPRAALDRYLAGVAHTEVTRVRLARGDLPVTSEPVAGPRTPATPPAAQPFWVRASDDGHLSWTPSSTRSQSLALVVMKDGGGPDLSLRATAAVTIRWLAPTTWGVTILGTVALLLGVLLLCWPRRRREIVYVVDPRQVPQLTAQLGGSVQPLAVAAPPRDGLLDLPDELRDDLASTPAPPAPPPAAPPPAAPQPSVTPPPIVPPPAVPPGADRPVSPGGNPAAPASEPAGPVTGVAAVRPVGPDRVAPPPRRPGRVTDDLPAVRDGVDAGGAHPYLVAPRRAVWGGYAGTGSGDGYPGAGPGGARAGTGHPDDTPSPPDRAGSVDPSSPYPVGAGLVPDGVPVEAGRAGGHGGPGLLDEAAVPAITPSFVWPPVPAGRNTPSV